MQTSSKLCSRPADRKLTTKINQCRCWPRYSYSAINNWRVKMEKCSWQLVCLCLSGVHEPKEWLIHTNNNYHILVIYSKVFQCDLHWSTDRVWQHNTSKRYPIFKHIRAIIMYYIIYCISYCHLPNQNTIGYTPITIENVFDLFSHFVTCQLQRHPCWWRDSWKYPGTQQYKVSSKMSGRWHISWCFFPAVLFIILDVELSPKVFDSKAFSFTIYKVMKVTVAHSCISNLVRQLELFGGWCIKLSKVLLQMSCFLFLAGRQSQNKCFVFLQYEMIG